MALGERPQGKRADPSLTLGVKGSFGVVDGMGELAGSEGVEGAGGIGTDGTFSDVHVISIVWLVMIGDFQSRGNFRLSPGTQNSPPFQNATRKGGAPSYFSVATTVKMVPSESSSTKSEKGKNSVAHLPC